MSRRTDKKRLKKINQTQAAAPAAASSAVPVPDAVPAESSAPAAAEPAPQAEPAPAAPVQAAPAPAEPAPAASAGYEMFLQYQNFEFGIGDIAKSILEKCSAEHMDSADLKIYVKPEDKKAYYVCAGGNSFIDL